MTASPDIFLSYNREDQGATGGNERRVGQAQIVAIRRSRSRCVVQGSCRASAGHAPDIFDVVAILIMLPAWLN